jgi:hypothetical protein
VSAIPNCGRPRACTTGGRDPVVGRPAISDVGVAQGDVLVALRPPLVDIAAASPMTSRASDRSPMTACPTPRTPAARVPTVAPAAQRISRLSQQHHGLEWSPSRSESGPQVEGVHEPSLGGSDWKFHGPQYQVGSVARVIHRGTGSRYQSQQPA